MAYNSFQLSVLAYANGFTQWHYRTDDTVEEVSRTGYFAGSDMLRRGDHVLANCSNGNVALFAVM